MLYTTYSSCIWDLAMGISEEECIHFTYSFFEVPVVFFFFCESWIVQKHFWQTMLRYSPVPWSNSNSHLQIPLFLILNAGERIIGVCRLNTCCVTSLEILELQYMLIFKHYSIICSWIRNLYSVKAPVCWHIKVISCKPFVWRDVWYNFPEIRETGIFLVLGHLFIQCSFVQGMPIRLMDRGCWRWSFAAKADITILLRLTWTMKTSCFIDELFFSVIITKEQ